MTDMERKEESPCKRAKVTQRIVFNGTREGGNSQAYLLYDGDDERDRTRFHNDFIQFCESPYTPCAGARLVMKMRVINFENDWPASDDRKIDLSQTGYTSLEVTDCIYPVILPAKLECLTFKGPYVNFEIPPKFESLTWMQVTLEESVTSGFKLAPNSNFWKSFILKKSWNLVFVK